MIGRWLVLLVLGVLVLLVLGGMVSALLEARREKAAGLPVSRPARDARAARRHARESQGRAPYLRGLVKGLRS